MKIVIIAVSLVGLSVLMLAVRLIARGGSESGLGGCGHRRMQQGRK